jgi:tetratricopeptide (TPR) repeat protein
MFRAWLEAPDPEQDALVASLPALPEDVWRAVRAEDASLTSRQTTRTLITMAHDALGRDPARSVWIAALAIRVARDTWESESSLDDVLAAEGDAWREYAAALLEIGHYPDARFAVHRARAVYGLTLGSAEARAVLSVIEGRILHELGFSDRGIELIDGASRELLDRFGNRKAFVAARVAHAAILFNMGQFTTAASMLRRVSSVAEEQGDSETLAYVVNMVGRCSVGMGDFAAAEQCFKTALAMFEAAKLYAEMPRVRKGIVDILVAKGRYHEAISELYMARAEFVALDLPVIAALVAVDITDLLLRVGRTSQVVPLATDMIKVFTAAGLLENAVAPLEHLRELAERGALTEIDVQLVRGFLELLPSDPTRRFKVR